LQNGKTYLICTKATLDGHKSKEKLEAPLQAAKQTNCPFYFALLKAEVNPTRPGNQKYYIHIVFESNNRFPE
jgi:hypothetical protein